MDRGQAAAEMVKILRALGQSRLHLAGHDQAAAAAELADGPPRYSPLRALVEQAENAAEEVLVWLKVERT